MINFSIWHLIQDRIELVVTKKDGKSKKEDPRTDPPLEVNGSSNF